MIRIDEIDKKIIVNLQQNPDLTHMDLARKLDRSQPTITNRIRKLEKKGILLKRYFIDLELREFQSAFFFVNSVNKSLLIEQIKKVSQFINIFTISGYYDIIIWVYGKSFKEIEELANILRKNGLVRNIDINYVFSSHNECVIPLKKFNFS
jgi:DNA-binding Lrp family transcriptional regulator